MKITLSSNNRITIPKAIISELNLTIGQQLDLVIENGNIVLKTEELNIKESIPKIEEIETKEIEKSEEIVDSNKITKTEPINKTKIIGNIKIESNLVEGEKFSRKIYSECGLVIRTKNSYMTKFCEVCRGELAKQYGTDNHPCKYLKEVEDENDSKIEDEDDSKIEDTALKILEQLESNTNRKTNLNAYISSDEDVLKAKELGSKKEEIKEEEIKEEEIKPINSVKTIISKLTENVGILNKKLDNNINTINQENKEEIKPIDNRKFTPYKPTSFKNDYPPRDEYTTIKSVIISEGLKPCYNCGELCNRGFLLDEDFYCKRCTKNDFIHYLKKGGRK